MSKDIKLLIECGALDHNGFKVDLAGVKWPEKTPLTCEFNQEYLFGYSQLTREEKGIYATLEEPPLAYFHAYPCVSFNFDMENVEEVDGAMLIKECNITEVSFCLSPNLDSSIKSVMQQLKDQENATKQ